MQCYNSCLVGGVFRMVVCSVLTRKREVCFVEVKDPCVSNQNVSSYVSAILWSDVWQPAIVAPTEASGTEEDMANICIWPLSYVVVWALGPCRLPSRLQKPPVLGARLVIHLQQNLKMEVSYSILLASTPCLISAHRFWCFLGTHWLSKMKVSC